MEQNNKSFLKWALIGILVLVLIIVGVIIFLRNRNTNNSVNTTDIINDTTTEDTTIADVTNSDNSLLNESETTAKATFDQFEKTAYAKAKIWKENVSLRAASVKMSSDLSPQSATYSYIYGIPEDQTYYFNINFNSAGDFLRALIWQTDYIKANLPAINFEFFKVSFFKALQIAETNGGQSFRSEYPSANITLNLYKAAPNNYNYWFVQYEDTLTPEKLIKQIDASTGEVISNTASSNIDDDSTSNSEF
ncbi:MAG: hypothetical protein PHW50_01070 [Patescibacteria group bacterium]|nr:hypothetical protein [Patescibacteria group bacterium]